MTKMHYQWTPDRTWVFMVGVLEWKNKSFCSYPKEGRRDAELIETFVQMGVPPEQIVYLKDKEAVLRTVKERFVETLKKTQEGDLLFFYYCGHGTIDREAGAVFAAFDSTRVKNAWSVRSIVKTIEETFSGSHLFLTADCCYSGALALEAGQQQSLDSYAVVTSSTSDSSSSENWTLTQCLLDAFRGESFIDMDGDGWVSIKDLQEYASDETAVFEDSPIDFASSGEFGSAILVKAKESVHERAGERVSVRRDGRRRMAKIIDARENEVQIRYIEIARANASTEWVSSDIVMPIDLEQFPVGTHLEVEWCGRWYAAKVLETSKFLHLITYPGFSDVWDEWVTSRRMRPAIEKIRSTDACRVLSDIRNDLLQLANRAVEISDELADETYKSIEKLNAVIGMLEEE